MNMFQFPPIKNFTEQGINNAFLKAENIIRFYYIILLYFSLTSGLLRWLRFLSVTEVDPLWPVSWIHFVDTSIAVNIIFSAFIVGALFSAIFPHHRFARILAFLGFFEFVAFTNSFGKIDHGFHVWVLTSFLLIFLPSVKHKLSLTPIYQRKFLLVFWGCQAIVLLTYTMSGIYKIYYAFIQMRLGETHAFHPQAMSYQVADRLLQTNSTSLLGAWIIDHIWIGWPFYVSAIFIEFFAFFAVFRPSLHRLWAIAIISMHISIYLIMGVTFNKNILLLALLFFNSPFIVAHSRWEYELYDLPIIGFFFRKLHRMFIVV